MSAALLHKLDNIANTTPTFTKVSSAVATLVAIYAVRKYLSRSPLAAVPGPPSPSYLTGHFKSISFSKDGIQFSEDITEEYGGVVKLKTLLGGEMLYVSDPLALQHITREIDVWQKAPFLNKMTDLIFGPGLLSSYGEAHRRQRKMLNPIFTVPYIRHLTPVFYAVAYQLRDTMRIQIGLPSRVINIREPLTQVAVELIGQAGLGYNFGSLQGESHVYIKASKDILPAIASIGLLIPTLPFLTRIGSPAFRRKVTELLPWPALRRVMQNVDDMEDTSIGIYENKKTNMLQSSDAELTEALAEDAKDIVTQLLKANSEASEGDKLPEAELVAQLTTLLFAASDTTSTALSRVLHLLSTHQDVQDRLRTEIMEARRTNHEHDLDFQSIEDLQFLSAVLYESLRLHPPVPHLPRCASKDDVIPLRYPITSIDGLTQLTSLPVPKGTEVIASIVSANTSKRIWGPDAAEWKPERWMNPHSQSLIDARVPGVLPNMMTFSNGAKSCIGYRFALQEMKVVLCVLLESFKFEADLDIEWHMGLMMTPYAVGNPSEPQLPLRVRHIGE